MSLEAQKPTQASFEELFHVKSTEVDDMDEEQLTRLLQKAEDVASDLDSRLDQLLEGIDLMLDDSEKFISSNSTPVSDPDDKS